MLPSDIVVSRFSHVSSEEKKGLFVLLLQSKKRQIGWVLQAKGMKQKANERANISTGKIFILEIYIFWQKKETKKLLMPLNSFFGTSFIVAVELWGWRLLSRCLIKSLSNFIRFNLFAFDCSYWRVSLNVSKSSWTFVYALTILWFWFHFISI